MNNIQEILDREAVILKEFKTMLPDTTPVLKFMNHSDRAFKIQEERRKAAEAGLIYHG